MNCLHKDSSVSAAAARIPLHPCCHSIPSFVLQVCRPKFHSDSARQQTRSRSVPALCTAIFGHSCTHCCSMYCLVSSVPGSQLIFPVHAIPFLVLQPSTRTSIHRWGGWCPTVQYLSLSCNFLVESPLPMVCFAARSCNIGRCRASFHLNPSPSGLIDAQLCNSYLLSSL